MSVTGSRPNVSSIHRVRSNLVTRIVVPVPHHIPKLASFIYPVGLRKFIVWAANEDLKLFDHHKPHFSRTRSRQWFERAQQSLVEGVNSPSRGRPHTRPAQFFSSAPALRTSGMPTTTSTWIS